MKNLSLANINNFIETEINKLCAEYEEKIKHLEELNKKLEQSLSDSQQKILKLTSEMDQSKENIISNNIATNDMTNQFPYDITNGHYNQKDLMEKAKSIDTMSKKTAANLMNKMNSLLLTTDNDLVIKSILIIYNTIKVDHKLNQLKQVLISNGYQNLKKLLDSPSNCIEKIQLLSNLKLINYQKKYIRKLLTSDLPINTFTDKELANLFWYAYLFDYDSLFLKQFKNKKNWLSQTNPTTKIYFEQIKEENIQQFSVNLKQVLTSMGITKFTDLEILKKKLFKKNLVSSSNIGGKTNEKASDKGTPPIINYVYVIKQTDYFKFIDTFSLKPSTISVKFIHKSDPKKFYIKTIQALIDPKESKAYITEKDLLTLKTKHSPLHLKISGYPDFKWPSTEISNSAVSNGSSNLQQVSDLKSLGYHHELDKNTRWEILCKAVKQLGLKKVAYTLASNTKRLKGRKPDSPTIKIWETDLNRLKQKFYRSEFQWPSTKISNN